MYEIRGISRYKGEHRRRWFQDEHMDLLVWLDNDGAVWGFQLCYNAAYYPHVLTWTPDKGYRHRKVDYERNQTPILALDGHFNSEAVLEEFIGRGEEVPPQFRDFVIDKLRQYPKS